MNGSGSLNDIDAMVTRTIAGLTAIARRAAHYATLVLLLVGLVVIVSFLLGVAALDGGIETVWIVLGIAFGAIAIGSMVLGRWRIGAIRRDIPAVAGEVRALLKDGRRETIDIIDDFQRNHDDSTTGSMIVVSRDVMGLRGLAGHGFAGSAKLTKTITAITSFPLLALTAIMIAIVFSLMIPIFLLALAL